MKHVSPLPIVDSRTCEAELKKTEKLRNAVNFIDSSSICAGGEGVDTCEGDGGSPLVCMTEDTKKYVQLGIVAWGIGCNVPGRPAVYTNVQHHMSWINEQIKLYYGEADTRYYNPNIN